MKKFLFLILAVGLFSAGFADLAVVRTIPVGGPGGLKGPAWSAGNGFISEGPNGVEYQDLSEWFAVKGNASAAFMEHFACDTETYLVAASGDSGVSFTNNSRPGYHMAFPVPGGARDIIQYNTSYSHPGAIVAGDSGIYHINYGCMGANPGIVQRIGLPATERVAFRNINRSVEGLFALHNAGNNITIFTKLWSDSLFTRTQTLFTGGDTCGIDVSPNGHLIYYAGGDRFIIFGIDTESYVTQSRTWLSPGHLDDIAVDHDRKYAYILMTNFYKCGGPRCGVQRVFVLDVKDPKAPVLADSLNLELPDGNEYAAAGNIRRLFFKDSLLYAANLNHGVVVARAYGLETAAENKPDRKAEDDLQLAPNPFNPAAAVSFRMERAGTAKIEAFSLNGRRILSLSESFSAGRCSVPLNLKGFPSGMYLFRVTRSGRILEKAAFLCK